MDKAKIDFLNRVRADNLISEESGDFIRLLDDGGVIFINRLAFTWGVYLLSYESFLIGEMYDYRFCFPKKNAAIEFFNSAKAVDTIPLKGWVAARPEYRLLLPRDLLYYLEPEQIPDFLSKGLECQPIEELISLGFYSLKTFENWQNTVRPNYKWTEEEQKFIHYLKEAKNETHL